MTAGKKKGIVSKLFGTKKSSCCGVRIEEVTAEEAATSENGEEAQGGRE